jgi:hypothetical protein
MKNAFIAAALGRWRSQLFLQQRIRSLARKVILRMDNVPLATALESWKMRSADCQRLKRAAIKVLRRMKLLTLAAPLDSWKGNSMESRRLKLAALRVASRLLNAKIASAFCRWQAHIAEYRLLCRAAHSVVIRMANAVLARSLNTWQAETVERRRQLQIMRNVAARFSGSLLGLAMTTWRDNTSENLLRVVRIRKVVSRMCNLTLATAAAAWRSAAAARRRQGQVALRALLRLAQLRQAKAMDAWLECQHSAHADETFAETERLRSAADRLQKERDSQNSALAAAGLGNPAVLSGLLGALQGQDVLQPVVLTQLLRKAAARPRGFLHSLCGLVDCMGREPPLVSPADLCSLLDGTRASPLQQRPSPEELVETVRAIYAPQAPLLPSDLVGVRKLLPGSAQPIDLNKLAAILNKCPSLDYLEQLACTGYESTTNLAPHCQDGGIPLPPRIICHIARSTSSLSNNYTVALESQLPGGAIYYTTDLSEPGPPLSAAAAGSSACDISSSNSPSGVTVALTRTTVVRALCISGASRSQVVTIEVVVPQMRGLELTATPPPATATGPLQPPQRTVVGGIGMLIARSTVGGHVIVKTLTPGGAAVRSPIKVTPGDVLVSVDGRDVRGLGTQAIARLITGQEGSKVDLTLLCSGGMGCSSAEQSTSAENRESGGVYHVVLTRTIAGYTPDGPPPLQQQQRPTPTAERPRTHAGQLPGSALAAAAAAGSFDELARFRDWLASAGWPVVGLGGGDEEEIIV